MQQPQIQQQIETNLNNSFNPEYLEVINESHMHGTASNESHFKAVIVSDIFNNIAQVKRHQMVYACLAKIMPNFHALALQTQTPEQWQITNNKIVASPNCHKSPK